MVVLAPAAEAELTESISAWRGVTRRLGLLVRCANEAATAERLGFDLVFAKGHEAGGVVREETSFILLQALKRTCRLPIYAWGGVGLHTAAACRAAGAAGVVLDWQLALTRESPLPECLKRRIAAMDGSETVAVPGPGGELVRLYHCPGMTARDHLRATAEAIHSGNAADPHEWDESITRLMNEPTPEGRLWPMGQDVAFAATFAHRTPSVAQALRKLREQVDAQTAGCAKARALRSDGPMAASHGTAYPVVQGPMTRVSDVPEFCAAVAEGGGLPMLALALLRRAQVRTLLEQTRELLGPRPWGVGILGFADRQIRAEQLEVIEDIRPPFAIIAGGRPDQAASMEAKGITTYLHVPSPGMLETFVREGARRFIFEGRECGGHVGPRTSFVLWDTMVRVLLNAKLTKEQAADVHVLFAGGIHDAVGGAMVSAIASPLVDRGMKIGVLIGTGYLFTEEIVRTGGILKGFQDVALATRETLLIETGPGHVIRCADTPYIHEFDEEKRRLLAQGLSHEALRGELERANVGRLRIAAKGITRRPDAGADADPFIHLDENEQRREGVYMIGQVAALRDEITTVRGLHENVCNGAVELVDSIHSEPATAATASDRTPPPLDIAIVGMSCLLPGAKNLREFWNNVLAGRDAVSEVPPDRFNADDYYDADRSARDKCNSKWGGFLPDVVFDPLKYGIPPAAVPNIEPVQLLALEMIDQALRDAGYDGRNPYRERTSIILGAGGGMGELGTSYGVRSMLPRFVKNIGKDVWDALPEWTEDSFPGFLLNVIAGRAANRFDCGGVNYTVDAACASSLAAVYLACRELTDGTSDMVVTGGVDTMQHPFAFMAFAKTGALSPRGRSRTFDAGADGIAISEGLAAVVLKRREDAERDGDPIYAVIRGVAGGSDGRSKSMTAPCAHGQTRTVQRAYAQAGFSPATVELFEAHGTGTPLGDQTECEALSALLTREGAAPRSIAIGSVKSMIGHTKCAAGVVGLMKAALAISHRVLPPTIHVEQPNAKGGLATGPLYVNSELRPWLRGRHPRRAGISAFGFGGSNFHAII
ncbi:MAG: nitronate monooxygenase, partial [Planctomycetes bacterium]|nr:nitronate monooxygenase [Planctomycetota bacterium]